MKRREFMATGALAAAGQQVLFCDADLSQSVEELTRLPAHLTVAPVVIASREVAGARRVGEPGHRHHMGRVFNLIVRMLGEDDELAPLFSRRSGQESMP